MSLDSLVNNGLGYQFKNPALLLQALTHRSFAANNNERLEFLGDSVLNFIIAHQLYLRFTRLPEGDLSRLRAQLVKESSLADIAFGLNLGDELKLGEGELKSAGWRRPSILADAMEAIIGAVYIDGGFAQAEELVLKLYADKLANIDPKMIDKDAKSQLQEYLQGKKIELPDYHVLAIDGEAHAQTFRMQCVINKLNITTVGEGSSRRIAEQQAAQLAMNQIAESKKNSQMKQELISNNFRCGTVAIVGRPNVGKSTLLNHILGMKLAITSRKAQTTRHRLLGIHTTEDTQFVFVDTPGFQQKHLNALNKTLNKTVTTVLTEVDVVLFVIEPMRLGDADRKVLELLPKDKPVILVVNKADLMGDKNNLLPLIQDFDLLHPFVGIIPVSAKKSLHLDELLETTRRYLPEQEAMYGEDELTDKTERFLAAEMIREKIFRLLGDEVPYSVTVEIEKFETVKNLKRIFAAIIVDKDSQKPMLIGKNGEKMKQISTEARQDMEKLFGSKVYLETWVKVKGGWADDERALKSLGY